MDLFYIFGLIFLSFIVEYKSYVVMYRFFSIFIVLFLVVYFYIIFVVNINELEVLEEEIF